MPTPNEEKATRSTPSVRVSASLINAAREVGPTQGRSMSSQIDYWARLGKSIEDSPEFNRERVNAALRGEYNSAELNADESEAFFEGLADAMTKPTPESDAFYAKLTKKGGGYGTDEDGRLIRGLPGGGYEVVEPNES